MPVNRWSAEGQHTVDLSQNTSLPKSNHEFRATMLITQRNQKVDFKNMVTLKGSIFMAYKSYLNKAVIRKYFFQV